MELDDLVRQVQRRFGDQIGSVITQQDVFDWVNEATVEIAKETKLKFVETTLTIGSYLAAVPVGIQLSNPVAIEYIKLDDRFLDIKDYKVFEDTTWKMNQVGWPRYYYLVESGQDTTDPNATIPGKFTKIKLFPNPDSSMATGSLVVGYRSLPVPVTSITSPIDLPAQFHPDVMNFCLIRAHERNKDWQGMNIAQQNFNMGLTNRNKPAGNVETSWATMQDVIGY